MQVNLAGKTAISDITHFIIKTEFDNEQNNLNKKNISNKREI